MKLLPLLASLLLYIHTSGQNLVPNSSFEDFTDCPSGIGQVYKATNWMSADMTSADFYHACYTNPASPGMDVPGHTMNGYQDARTGGGYAGVIIVGSQEKVLTELISPLQKGVTYKVEFYVNVHNDVPLGCDGIGMYISENKVTDNQQLNQLAPQVHNPLGETITDTLNWTLVSGSYVAKGGEKYIAIGNFLEPNEATTTVINSNVINPAPMSSYFYIDDVSITVDPLASVNELTAHNDIVIYPNPAKNQLSVAVAGKAVNSVLFFDVTGRAQKSVTFTNTGFDVSSLSDGVYFIQITTQNGPVTKRFVKG